MLDDHPLVRRGLAETFAEEPDFEIVGDGGSAADAVLLARNLAPDLIMLDVSMPGGGIECGCPRLRLEGDHRFGFGRRGAQDFVRWPVCLPRAGSGLAGE